MASNNAKRIEIGKVLEVRRDKNAGVHALPPTMDVRRDSGEFKPLTYTKVPLSNIVPWRDDVDIDRAHVERLKVSLLSRGQVPPVELRPVEGKQSSYQLIAGHHRWAASQELVEEGHLEFKNIDALIRYTDDISAMQDYYLSNHLARAHKPSQHLEMVDAFYDVIVPEKKKNGSLPADVPVLELVSQQLGIKPDEIKRLRAISRNMIPAQKELLSKYYYAFTTAYEISKLLPEVQELLAQSILLSVPEPVVTDVDKKSEIKHALTGRQVKTLVSAINKTGTAVKRSFSDNSDGVSLTVDSPQASTPGIATTKEEQVPASSIITTMEPAKTVKPRSSRTVTSEKLSKQAKSASNAQDKYLKLLKDFQKKSRVLLNDSEIHAQIEADVRKIKNLANKIYREFYHPSGTAEDDNAAK